uniref:Uncharacterized protein n=1 Tax=Rhizophora mucronata TaxID=61149 RepID=A0A2P2PSK4_RHIMU
MMIRRVQLQETVEQLFKAFL